MLQKRFRFAREISADVMLLDISLPDRSGMDALKCIRRDNQQLSVLIALYVAMEDQYAVRALKSGASGYLCQTIALLTNYFLLFTLLAKGKKYITPEVAEILARAGEVMKNHEIRTRHYLTANIKAMIVISSGFSVSEIADKLSLSVKTVSMYRTRLLEKNALAS